MGKQAAPEPEPLAMFRLYPTPEHRWLFVRVRVWPTLEAMYEFYPVDRDHAARCTAVDVTKYRPDGTARKRGEFAEIDLCAERLNIYIISHECVHAMFALAKRTKVTTNELERMEVEEILCYAHTAMFDQCLAHLDKHQLRVTA